MPAFSVPDTLVRGRDASTRPPRPLLDETRGLTNAERRRVQTTAQPAAPPIPYSEPTKTVTNCIQIVSMRTKILVIKIHLLLRWEFAQCRLRRVPERSIDNGSSNTHKCHVECNVVCDRDPIISVNKRERAEQMNYSHNLNPSQQALQWFPTPPFVVKNLR